MPALEHPSEVMLAAVLNEAMPPDRVEEILEHLDECERCERRLEQLEPGIAEYRRFRQRILPQLPQPLRPWPDLQLEMDRVDRLPSQPRSIAVPRRAGGRGKKTLRSAWISALAAGILVAGLLLWPRGDGLLRAEILLEKAASAAAKSPARARSHLRVRTRTASFTRPAVLRGGGTDPLDGLQTRFQAAHYDWSDPLNPAVFSNWRNGLQKRVDKVELSAGHAGSGESQEYTLHTATPDGPLREAALTVEASDMLPVSGRFQFADSEWVEIATLPDAPAPTAVPETSPLAPAIAPPVVVNRPVLSQTELAGRELMVRDAIDRMQGGIGQPIGIETESGKIVVTIYNLAPQQEGQLRAGLRDMEGVIVRSSGRGPDSGPDTPPGSPSALAAPFPAIDTSEAILSRAHVLNQLSVRFPPEVEARLSATGRGLLADMRSRHLASINREIDTLSSQLSGTRPWSIAKEKPPRDAGGSSPPSVAALTQAATAVHRLVTSVYAGGAGQVDAASAWPELDGQLSTLRRVARQLAQNSLETVH